MSIQNILHINWSCYHTWLKASKNTSWCLFGCCIGDFGTIAFFQFAEIAWPVLAIMCLAIINGILTSIEYDQDEDGIVDDSDNDGIPDYLDSDS